MYSAVPPMRMHVRAAEMAMQRENVDPDGDTAHGVQELSGLAQGALAEVGALIFELRPGALAEEGLVEALRKQALATAAREGMRP